MHGKTRATRTYRSTCNNACVSYVCCVSCSFDITVDLIFSGFNVPDEIGKLSCPVLSSGLYTLTPELCIVTAQVMRQLNVFLSTPTLV